MNDRRDGDDRTKAADEKRRRGHRTRMLNAAELELERTAGGFISLTVRGEEPDRYERINAFRSFPLSASDQYISLRDREGDEIGEVFRTLGERIAEAKKPINHLSEHYLGYRRELLFGVG